MPAQPKPRLETEIIDDVIVVKFINKRITNADEIEIIGEELYRLVEHKGHSNLLLNFMGVEFLSSALLGKLVSLHGKVNKVGGKLVLCGIEPTLYEVFVICNLPKLLNIQKNEEAGLQSF